MEYSPINASHTSDEKITAIAIECDTENFLWKIEALAISDAASKGAKLLLAKLKPKTINKTIVKFPSTLEVTRFFLVLLFTINLNTLSALVPDEVMHFSQESPQLLTTETKLQPLQHLQ